MSQNGTPKTWSVIRGGGVRIFFAPLEMEQFVDFGYPGTLRTTFLATRPYFSSVNRSGSLSGQGLCRVSAAHDGAFFSMETSVKWFFLLPCKNWLRRSRAMTPNLTNGSNFDFASCTSTLTIKAAHWSVWHQGVTATFSDSQCHLQPATDVS